MDLDNSKNISVRGYDEWLATLILYHGKEDADFVTAQTRHYSFYYRTTNGKTYSLGHYNHTHNIGSINGKTS